MQISAESVKFYFYTEHSPKSNRESELNLSFDKKKDRLALGFFKVSCRLYATIKTKSKTSVLAKLNVGFLQLNFGKSYDRIDTRP